MTTSNKQQRDMQWWENIQATAMRLAYIVFSIPALYGMVNILRNGSLGDPLSAGFQIKLWLGAAVLVIILVFPAYIQLKIKKLRTKEEAAQYVQRLKPLPVDLPVYLYFVSLALLPYTITYAWLGIGFGILCVCLSELYLWKTRAGSN